MSQKYVVKLNETERYQLKQLISTGTAPARKLRRAHILLKSDSSEAGPNRSYQAIMEAYEVSNVTISATRRAYVEVGLEAALLRKKPQRTYERRLDGEAEALSWLLDSSIWYFGVFDENIVRSRLCLLTGSTLKGVFMIITCLLVVFRKSK